MCVSALDIAIIIISNLHLPTSTSHFVYPVYSGQIFALFILCKEAKKISKSLQRKRRNCERRKNENSNSFSAQIKWYYHAFQFPVVNRKTVDQKPLFCIFSSNFTVVLCSNVIKNFQIWNYFIILTNFLQNKCKIRDVSPIFFFAFFASFYLQRIFFAKIFFVCKDSSFAVQYII